MRRSSACCSDVVRKGKTPRSWEPLRAKDLEMTKTVLATGGLSESALSDALESATRGGSKDVAALLEQAGAKPFVEFKIDEADLAKYAGTYRNISGAEVVLAVIDGHLTGGPGGQRASLVARDRTTFKLAEAPGITVTFRLDSGNVVDDDVQPGRWDASILPRAGEIDHASVMPRSHVIVVSRHRGRCARRDASVRAELAVVPRTGRVRRRRRARRRR